MFQIPAMSLSRRQRGCGRTFGLPKRDRNGKRRLRVWLQAHRWLRHRWLQQIATLAVSVALLLVAHLIDMRRAIADPRSRPNVILVMADDIGYECFGCYGSSQYSTPHIDQLAREGMRFTSFHAQPLCTPTRIELMTGLSNVRNYAAFSVLRRDQKTIGQFFREAGYATAVAGKWQLLGAEHYPKRFRGKGTWPTEAGFDETCLWQVDRMGKRYWSPLLSIHGKNRQFGKDQYGPDIATAFLIDFMKRHRDKPFFIYYPMILVHNPFIAPPGTSPEAASTPQLRFEAMVAYMDRLVGRLVSAVDELGLAENTLILFLGDNGTNRAIRSKLGERVIRGGKGTTTDAGTHVPFVARWKGTIPAGRVCDDLAAVCDILPTLADATHLSLPEDLDGRSFWPQLQGKRGSPRSWLYSYYNPRPEKTRPVRMAWDHSYKLYADGRFFHISEDPEERRPLTNWSDNPAAARARAKLQAAIDSFPKKGQALLQFPP